MGYIDVYPAVQAFVSLFILGGVRALSGGGLTFPLVVAAIGPFAYVGLSLLAIPAAVLSSILLYRDGWRRVVGPALVAVVAGGMCTTPLYGRPFDLVPFVESMRGISDAGLGPGPLLPGWYFWTRYHLLDVLNSSVLIDGAGILLCLTLAWTIRSAVGWFLLSVFLPVFLHSIVTDPLFGPYSVALGSANVDTRGLHRGMPTSCIDQIGQAKSCPGLQREHHQPHGP